MEGNEGLIGRHGGYRNLKSYQISQLLYDFTVRFCDRYIDRRSRTHDQMVQAARSGSHNIGEGSMASATSKKTEIVLTNVARSSQDELRQDYEAFLRQRQLAIWPPNDPRRKSLIDRRPQNVDEIARWIEALHTQGNKNGSKRLTYAEIAANAALTLLAVDRKLLGNQIDSQAKTFEKEGGFTERLYQTRKKRRDKKF